MGHRIELGEIEAAAAKCEGVSRAACVYDNEGKRIILFYSGNIDSRSLDKALQSYLPRYMCPQVIEKLDMLPLTDNGKIHRRELGERAKNL
jgi:acyl-coenzyme A synthetase/AMP-(fatty) acid ligase